MLDYEHKNGILNIFFSGNFDYKLNPKIAQNFKNIVKNSIKNSEKIILNFKDVENFDYFFAVFIKKSLIKANYEIINENEKIKKIFKTLENADFSENIHKKNINFIIKTLNEIGIATIDAKKNLTNLTSFMGEFFIKFFALTPKKMRLKEMSNCAKDAGIDAVFIVSLTAFLVGIVLAYIGSDMLAQFGASIYIIDIMGMLTLREIAPLIAAIVIAGRSASSFTAQIGVMKITEEIDAMKTMGFDPFYFLCMPRILAMIIITPFVIFLADAVSIFSQMIVCDAYLEISFADYLERFKSTIEIRHFLVGIVKAPFFGAIIAIVGCLRGFEVKNDTRSIGEYTTISVVNAIFWVIALDAFFAVMFSELKI